MKSITVSAQILDGNLGEGWSDEYESAVELAEFTKNVWVSDLAELAADGYEINIDIEICRNTTGYSRQMSVDVDGCDDAAFDLQKRAEGMLTDESTIWEKFCSSDVAAGLAA